MKSRFVQLKTTSTSTSTYISSVKTLRLSHQLLHKNTFRNEINKIK